MKSGRVSVIIPVFQVMQWLDRCVASIKAQTYKDLEIILVDDGSTDGSGERCDELAAGDDRITVIHQNNRGLSAARNRGVEAANGDWVMFVDSDDWVHSEITQRLLSMTVPEVDIAVASFVRVPRADLPPLSQLDSTELLSRNEALARYFTADRTLLTIACGKLFRRELLAGIRFPEGRLHEDEATTYKLLAKARRVALTRIPLYFYFANPDSITGSGLSTRNLVDIVHAAAERQEFFQEHGPPPIEIAAKVDLTRKLIQLHQAYVDAGEQALAQNTLARVGIASRLIPIRSRPLTAIFARSYPSIPTVLRGLQRARLSFLRALGRARPRP